MKALQKQFNEMNLEGKLYDLCTNKLVEDYFLDEEQYDKSVVDHAFQDLTVDELRSFAIEQKDFSSKEVDYFFDNCDIDIDYSTYFDDKPYGRIYKYKRYTLEITFDYEDVEDEKLNFDIQDFIESNAEEFYDYVLKQRYDEFGGDERFKLNYARNEDIFLIENYDQFIDMIDEDGDLSDDEFIQRYLNF
jgi:hypothetical protein